MPTGGTWTVQNKVRAGAYINFVSVAKPVGSVSDRGYVAVACNLNWGAEEAVIKVTGADLLNGSAFYKIGYDGINTDSLPIRCALSGAYTCYFVRLQTSCAKATATVLSTGTVTAKYGGTMGNELSVVCAQNTLTGLYDFEVKYKGVVKESASVADWDALEETAFELVTITHTGTAPTLAAISETALSSGTNGTAITAGDFGTKVLSKLAHTNFNVFAVQGAATTYNSAITAQLTQWRNNFGKRCQAVLYEAAGTHSLDREDIISVFQGFKTADEEVTTALFPIWVASQQAGAGINQSLTAKEISDANEIVEVVSDDEVAGYLQNGKYILTYRQDGAVVVEKDINSLHTFTADKNYAFSKNRVMRVLDQLANDVTLIFNKNYCGKIGNDDAGRNVFKSEVVHLVDQMTDLGAVQNFDSTSDINIMQGEAVDSVVVDMEIQPVDAMEKLYMTVNVNA